MVGMDQSSGSATFAWVSNISIGTGDFKTLLQACNGGLDLNGWTLQVLTDITADGRAIVGYGVNPGGKTEAFLVRLR